MSSTTTPASADDFSAWDFAPSIRQAIIEQGYTTPTPIQAAAIGPILEGRDCIGCAQTGTGKTAAFALPALQRLLQRRATDKRPRMLVIAPTRELAEQIRVSCVAYAAGSRLRCTAVYGGVGMQPQVRACRTGVDVLVACPGRLLDLMGQGHIDLGAVELLVLDEADRMLDMGFAPDIRRILAAVPAQRQTLLFSATMPDAVRELAEGYLNRPVRIAVTPDVPSAETVEQRVFHVERSDKTAVLHGLLRDGGVDKAVVFTRTKHGADRLARKLARGGIACQAIHGNKSQGARTRAMDAFRDGSIRALIASDIAARGLDVQGITHAVNFDLPREAETYVHRIGRCGRAGAQGMAWSLCAPEERAHLAVIERGLGRHILVAEAPGTAALDAPPPTRLESSPAPTGRPGTARPQGQGGRRRRRRSRPQRHGAA